MHLNLSWLDVSQQNWPQRDRQGVALEYAWRTNFQGAEFYTDHYLFVAKFRESLAVSKEAAQRFMRIRFNLWKLHELEFRKQKQKIWNKFAALENLIVKKNISSGLKSVKENIKTSAKESLVLYEFKLT
jgi:methyltransferase-like protein